MSEITIEQARLKLETLWRVLTRMGVDPYAFKELPEAPAVAKGWHTGYATPEMLVAMIRNLAAKYPHIRAEAKGENK